MSFVTGGAAVPAVKQATSVIPTVFAVADDPVGMGLVASLARPGGNVTGLSAQQADLVGKRIELMRELIPGLRRLAILANTDAPGVGLEMAEAQTVAGRLGLQVVTSTIRRAEDIAPAFEAIEGRADALYVCGDALTATAARLMGQWLSERLGQQFVIENRPGAPPRPFPSKPDGIFGKDSLLK